MPLSGVISSEVTCHWFIQSHTVELVLAATALTPAADAKGLSWQNSERRPGHERARRSRLGQGESWKDEKREDSNERWSPVESTWTLNPNIAMILSSLSGVLKCVQKRRTRVEPCWTSHKRISTNSCKSCQESFKGFQGASWRKSEGQEVSAVTQWQSCYNPVKSCQLKLGSLALAAKTRAASTFKIGYLFQWPETRHCEKQHQFESFHQTNGTSSSRLQLWQVWCQVLVWSDIDFCSEGCSHLFTSVITMASLQPVAYAGSAWLSYQPWLRAEWRWTNANDSWPWNNKNPNTYRLHTDYIQITYRLHTDYIQITYRLHTDYIQITYRLHTDYIQITYRLHTDYIQITYRLHRGLVVWPALHILKYRYRIHRTS